eukprot:scaffold19795_cov126-Isochrysis_galbana.AAC.4
MAEWGVPSRACTPAAGRWQPSCGTVRARGIRSCREAAMEDLAAIQAVEADGGTAAAGGGDAATAWGSRSANTGEAEALTRSLDDRRQGIGSRYNSPLSPTHPPSSHGPALALRAGSC